MKRREFLAGAITSTLALSTTRARASATVRVLVPDPDNLQYIAFWLAKALFFPGAGIDVEIGCVQQRDNHMAAMALRVE